MIVRSYESLMTKYTKIHINLKFIKSGKKERLILKFAKVDLAIGNGSTKFNLRLARIEMENTMDNIHHQKRKLKREKWAMSKQFKEC